MALQKLTYLNMLGFDMTWAAFHVVEVMSASKFTQKLVGYHAATQSFSENTEVMLLITNLLKKDLGSTLEHERSLALDCLSNVATLDLARDLVADVYGLLSSSSVPSRKRAALVLYCCFLKYPDALRPCFKGLTEHLDDHDSSVVCSVVSVLCELVVQHPHNYLEMAPLFYKLMLTSNNNWMTMKLLKIFGALTPLEPRLVKKLSDPLKHIMSTSLAKSLIYECISTVCSGMTSNAELVEMALEHLKGFVLDMDPNLKYLGFRALEQFVKHIPESVMRFGAAALGCLASVDPTIRSSALRVISGLVSKQDLKEVVTRVLEYIPTSDSSYRNELSETILKLGSRDKYSMVSDFAWYLNVLVELARVPDTVHGKDIAFQINDIACRVEAMRDNAVQAVRSLLIDPSVFEAASSSSVCEVLKATAWITGEYAACVEHPRETIESLLQTGILKLPAFTQAIFVQATLKVFIYVAADLIAEPEQEDGGAEGDDKGEKGMSQYEMIVDLANLVDGHIGQYVCNVDPEIVERICQVREIVSYAKNIQEQPEVKDFIVNLAGIIAVDLKPVSGKTQSKIPPPPELDMPIAIDEGDDDDVEPGADAEESDASEDTRAQPQSYNEDAASMLTEVSSEQRKKNLEEARDKLKQHRERHDIFYLNEKAKPRDGEKEAMLGEDATPDQKSDFSVDHAAASSSVDSVYSKRKKNRMKSPSEVVILKDQDVGEGDVLSDEPSPMKNSNSSNQLDVNVFAPLEEGESLPSTMAYPEARMTHAQHDNYDGSFRGPPEEGVPGDGQDALPQNEIFENNGKHKSRKKKHGEKGTKEHRHRRKHKHRSKKGGEDAAQE